MLGKVLKYDIKASAKMFLPLYLGVLVITALAKVSVEFLVEVDNLLLSILSGTSILLYVAALFGLMIMTVIFLIIRFYKNFLTDEAYLTFTLPVKTSTLIVSKQLNGILWNLLTMVVLAAAVGGMFGKEIWENRELLQSGWREIYTEIKVFVTPVVTVGGIISIILSLLFNLSTIYASLSIGQMYTKHKILGAIIAYIGIHVVLNMFGNVVLTIVDWTESVDAYMIYSVIEQLVVGAAGLGITYYFLKNKLNLE